MENKEPIVINGVDSTYYNNSSVVIESVDNNLTSINSYNQNYKKYLENFLNYEKKENKFNINSETIKNHFKFNGFTELILKTTDECNLRCKYCVYSDHYPYTSSYSKNRMNYDTAKRAIDYYMSLIIQQSEFISGKKPFIAFYGGEPLLNFDLIEKIINYVNLNYSDIDVNYTITTNGLPLKDHRISKFLKDNNVIVCVSIDGYEENHNRNRVQVNQKPTYREITEIIKKEFSDYPLIYSLCCIDCKTDLRVLYEHYMKNDRINGGCMPHLLRVSQIFDIGTDYYNQFTIEEKTKFINDLKWLEDTYKELAIKGESNWFLDLMVGQELLRIYDRPKFNQNRGLYYIDGCCVPGEKIYVHPNGDFGICEKVAIDDFIIGNIEEGLNYKKISSIIKSMNNMMFNQCKNCNVSSLCSVCYAQLTNSKKIDFSKSLCESRKNSYLHKLSIVYEINSKNPRFFKDKIAKAINRNKTESLLDIMLN